MNTPARSSLYIWPYILLLLRERILFEYSFFKLLLFVCVKILATSLFVDVITLSVLGLVFARLSFSKDFYFAANAHLCFQCHNIKFF